MTSYYAKQAAVFTLFTVSSKMHSFPPQHRDRLVLSLFFFLHSRERKRRKKIFIYFFYPGKLLVLMSIFFQSLSLNMLIPSRRLGILILGLLFLIEQSHAYMTTIITYEYLTSHTNYINKTQDSRTNGILSTRGSQTMVRRRSAVVLTDINGSFDGCQESINANSVNNSIAIIQRGGNCTFSVKITRAKQYGAAGKKREEKTSITYTIRFSFSCYYL